jgi:hypothetical protein
MWKAKINKTKCGLFAERGRRQRNFFKKIKNRLCRRPLPGTLGIGFSQKKQPLPTAFARGSRHRFFQKKRLSAKTISKTVNLTRRYGYLFLPTAHCGLSAQPLPRASSSGARQRAVTEKKFSVSPAPSATVGKAFAKRIRLLEKPRFPVVESSNGCQMVIDNGP